MVVNGTDEGVREWKCGGGAVYLQFYPNMYVLALYGKTPLMGQHATHEASEGEGNQCISFVRYLHVYEYVHLVFYCSMSTRCKQKIIPIIISSAVSNLQQKRYSCPKWTITSFIPPLPPTQTSFLLQFSLNQLALAPPLS